MVLLDLVPQVKIHHQSYDHPTDDLILPITSYIQRETVGCPNATGAKERWDQKTNVFITGN